MTRTIDLNADLGEGFPWDDALLAKVTSASVSCGAHAGDPDTIRNTLRAAKARGVVVGAHPGYPDREGFGRIDKDVSSKQVFAWVSQQFHDLTQLADSEGVSLRFVKPHGALYNQAQREHHIASGLIFVVRPLGLRIVGQPGSVMKSMAGRLFVSEGFIDRRYDAEGRLVPRSEPDAILQETGEIRDQIARLVGQGVGTLCLHGDNPHSLELADLALDTLRTLDVTPRSFA